MQKNRPTARGAARRAPPNYDVPSLRVAFEILENLSSHPRGRVLTEIAADLGRPVSSAFRIVAALEELGLVNRDPETRQIRMTQRLLLIGQRAITETNLLEHALDVMRELRDKVLDTVLVGVRDGTRIAVLDQTIGTRMFCFVSKLGYRVPIHCSAPGKAILASLPPGERDALVAAAELTRFNRRTITSRQALRRELTTVSQQGYAFDDAEQFDGVYCIGAPVFDRAGYPVSAIWVTGLMMDLDRKRIPQLGAAVRAHADRISARLGHAPEIQPSHPTNRERPRKRR